jgi:hypothetical protein
MKKNMSDDDRVIRLVSAFLFIVLYLQGIVKDPWGIVLPVLAGILIITGIIGFCPLYPLFRMHTNQDK